VQVRYVLQWPHRVSEEQRDRLYVFPFYSTAFADPCIIGSFNRYRALKKYVRCVIHTSIATDRFPKLGLLTLPFQEAQELAR
jgi:hypothetical protein